MTALFALLLLAVPAGAADTSTFTATRTLTATQTLTATVSSTATPSNTATPTTTATRTSTATRTPTFTPTVTTTDFNQTLTFAATSSFSPTNTGSNTHTATETNTATNTNTASVTRTRTVSRTATATRTSSITMTSTATATASATPTLTFSFTKTSTPSFTITNTGTPSGQRIKQQQIEGFLTPIAVAPAGSISFTLLDEGRQFASQFNRLAHGPLSVGNNWYDDITQDSAMTFYIFDATDVAVAGNYARHQFFRAVQVHSIDFYAITPSVGPGSDTFRFTDGSTITDIVVPATTAFLHTAVTASFLPSPPVFSVVRQASTSATPPQKITFTLHYTRF